MKDIELIIADIVQIGDIDRAVRACSELDARADASWLPALYRALTTPAEFPLRECAAVPIARLDGVRSLDRLIEALFLGEDEGVDNDTLENVIIGVVQGDSEAAVSILLGYIHSVSARVRATGVWLWPFALPFAESGPIVALVSDTDPRVRIAATGALGSYASDRRVIDALIARLQQDEDSEVRSSAARSLGLLGARSAIGALRTASTDESSEVRKWSTEALLQITRGKP